MEKDKTEAPHPKNDEELQKILDSIEEIGGPKKGKVIGNNWVSDGRECDF